MATVSSLVARVRLELGDQSSTFASSSVLDGVTNTLELPYPAIEPSLLVVFVNGVEALTSEYVFDARKSRLTLGSTPPAGTVVSTEGTHSRMFLTADLETFVTTAAAQHLHNRSGVTLANLPFVEEYPVALLAVVEALFALLNDSAYDIDIRTPEGVSIPRSQRYAQLMQMLEMRQSQYEQLASALNVGLNRIEMFTLRRISRTTNKLVPVYETQEFEDTSLPRRLHLPIDTLGAAPAPDTLADTVLTITQAEPFSQSFTIGQDITGKTVYATARRFRNSAAFRRFDVAIVDAVTGQVTISLDERDTILFTGDLWWDLQVADSDGVRQSKFEGPLLVEERPRSY